MKFIPDWLRRNHAGREPALGPRRFVIDRIESGPPLFSGKVPTAVIAASYGSSDHIEFWMLECDAHFFQLGRALTVTIEIDPQESTR